MYVIRTRYVLKKKIQCFFLLFRTHHGGKATDSSGDCDASYVCPCFGAASSTLADESKVVVLSVFADFDDFRVR